MLTVGVICLLPVDYQHARLLNRFVWNARATMNAESTRPMRRNRGLFAFGFSAVLLVSGLVLWGVNSGVPPRSTPLSEVAEIVAEIETGQEMALENADDYLAFLRERNLPGVFDYESPSWVLAENFYRAHWDVSNLRATSGWFTPDLETLSPASDWVLPETECSEQMVPGKEQGVEVFSARDRFDSQTVHYVGVVNGEGYLFSPLCNITPADRVAEARTALAAHLRAEAEAKEQGPQAYFEFVRETNYPDLYDTQTSSWRIGEAILQEVWELNGLHRADVRNLDSIGILDLTLSQGDQSCSPSKVSFPAALWVVTTPAEGGDPFVEYFHYHEGQLRGFVALCNVKASVNNRGQISLSRFISTSEELRACTTGGPRRSDVSLSTMS